MSATLAARLRGGGLGIRALRSAAIMVAGFGAGQVLRLASNLILTRLLFPEAFGVMAIVLVFVMGLTMFSDVGIGPAIMQSRRGDDPDFLDTAWTIQIGRGVLLWLAALGLSWPVAQWYGEPMLLQYLPVAAFALVINGFNPTRLETAHRHLRAGRVTLIELAVQTTQIAAAVVMAWAWGSVWALVCAALVAAVAQLVYLDRFLPGPRNRLRWEPEAARELVSFGKWIFLSTVAGFVAGQSDRVLIGGWLSLGDFGVYNIGLFLATFPMVLGHMVTRRVLIPVYRDSPPAEDPANFARLRRLRMAASAALLAAVAVFAFAGPWLIALMYDPRYAMAGGVVVLVAVLQLPALIGLTYDQAALAAGASRRFFVLQAARAALTFGAMAAGLAWGGFAGGLVGQGAAHLMAYPVLVWLARRQGVWDPLHDALFATLGAAVAALALWAGWPAVAALAAVPPG
ncbi:oligosaccharide flippase family protein [Limimaricola pyoseonensis]|uniref:Membrane protein involved in the export of O-antigen and teichoic acid n=1 Tax=Limimaricola pyoseonensis TaxID=521013 RepID=A0A1G7K2Y4_9RHOB|nr:oligosaccharide flippase family protein [Limimaricola pyoseonensis]SDF31394.1 Membrane protein involved in the export of O-antigen and teichoic acid [Limimaricola pyoseonensis]